MPKRSYIQSIKTKQSSAYRADRTSAQAIHRIDGSSRNEASRSKIKRLESWTIGSRGLSEAELDRIAETKFTEMLYGSWSKKLNPICTICYTMKSRSGQCSC